MGRRLQRLVAATRRRLSAAVAASVDSAASGLTPAGQHRCAMLSVGRSAASVRTRAGSSTHPHPISHRTDPIMTRRSAAWRQLTVIFTAESLIPQRHSEYSWKIKILSM